MHRINPVGQRSKQRGETREQQQFLIVVSNRKEREDAIGDRNGKVQRQHGARPGLCNGPGMCAAVEPQPRIEDHHHQRVDQRVDNYYFKVGFLADSPEKDRKEHACDRKKDIQDNLNYRFPVNPMTEHLDHDNRPLL